MSTTLKSTVRLQYFTLSEVKPNIENATPPMAFSGWMAHVGVDSLTRGSNRTQFILFFENLIDFSLTLFVGGGQRIFKILKFFFVLI
jgi:hypothetical protein